MAATDNSAPNGVNGESSKSSGLTAAQKLMLEHEKNDQKKAAAAAALDKTSAHKPIVEEVVDEEDIVHPATHKTSAGPILEEIWTESSKGIPSWVKPEGNDETGAGASSKGKAPQPQTQQKKATPSLDLKSDEAFPSLGGPRATGSSANAPSWGSKPSVTKAPPTNGAVGGSNGYASSTSSRASTPASGNRTPGTAASSASLPRGLRGPGGQLSLPGRTNQIITETINLSAEQLTPRNKLLKPVGEIVKEIQNRTKTTLQTSTSANGISTFIIKGSPEGVKRAIRDIGKELGVKVRFLAKFSILRSLRGLTLTLNYRKLQLSRSPYGHDRISLVKEVPSLRE
jgi:hypothetical protein